ncbi:MAG TPA: hypothetical protein VGS06_22765, partial [Streptosporangiaceae bacterium]|nr:hypothetical protein [Streptosporangiaceae bacterium]
TAETLIHASDAYQAAGDTSAARDALRQVLALLNDLHHPAAIARLLRGGRDQRSSRCATGDRESERTERRLGIYRPRLR